MDLLEPYFMIKPVASCRRCNRSFTRPEKAAAHTPCTRAMVRSGTYKCGTCPREFTKLSKLGWHKVLQHRPKRFTCKTCLKRFAVEFQCYSHCQDEHGITIINPHAAVNTPVHVVGELRCARGCKVVLNSKGQRRKHNKTCPMKSKRVQKSRQTIPVSVQSQQQLPASSGDYPSEAVDASPELDPPASDPDRIDTTDLELVLQLMKYCEICEGYFLSEQAMESHFAKHAHVPQSIAPGAIPTLSSNTTNIPDQTDRHASTITVKREPEVPNRREEDETKPLIQETQPMDAESSCSQQSSPAKSLDPISGTDTMTGLKKEPPETSGSIQTSTVRIKAEKAAMSGISVNQPDTTKVPVATRRVEKPGPPLRTQQKSLPELITLDDDDDEL